MKVLILDSAVEDSEYLSSFKVKYLPMFFQRETTIHRVSDRDIVDSDLIIIDMNRLGHNDYANARQISSPLKRRLLAGGVLVVFSAQPNTFSGISNYDFLYLILEDSYALGSIANAGDEIVYGEDEILKAVFKKHKSLISWVCNFIIQKGQEGFFPILGNKAHEIISCVLKLNHGYICLLPVIRDKAAFIDDFLPAFFDHFEPTSFNYTIAKREREPDLPWLSAYPVEGTETLLEEIKSKEEVIAGLQEESKKLERELESQYQYRDLQWQTGADWLEPAVKKFFELLGFECQTDDPIDLVGNFGDKQVRIEIVGTEGPIKMEKARQILQRIFDAEDPTKVKGVLVGNPFRKLPPAERPPGKEKLFVKEVEQMAETHDISLILTTEMFEVVQKILGGENVDRGAILRRMFENKGLIKLID